MTDFLLNAGGVIGVVMVLIAYAGIHVDRIDPKGAIALLMNLLGSLLILLSMVRGAFNFPAFLMEATWAAVAVYGLTRLRKR